MSISLGNTNIASISLGDHPVSKIFLGENQVYGGGGGPDYLCFTAEEDGSTIKFGSNLSGTLKPVLSYSRDGNNWDDYVLKSVITLNNVGDKVYFRGNNIQISNTNDPNYINKFSMTGRIAASGNVMSILDETLEKTSLDNIYCMYGLFSSCVGLIKAPKLPATEISVQGYASMFDGCTNLTQAPELPATTLAYRCYSSMFNGCTSLIQAPELPATTFGNISCYTYMFQSCTNLVILPKLPAITLTSECYSYMFSGCSSLKLSTTQDETYKYPYRIPTDGTGATASNALYNMFRNTGGPFTGTPAINTTYYTDHEPI